MTSEVKEIKRMILDVAYCTQNGHIPSSLSSVEILYTLYKYVAQITKPYERFDRDRVILSKEHARLAQVCILAHLGCIPKDLVYSYMENGNCLGHDLYGAVSDNKEIAAVDYASGSLGHGPSVGLGCAIANPQNNVYVIVGDGELQEGSCSEAFTFAYHHKLPNYTLIIDRNYNQIDGKTCDIIDSSSNLYERMVAFGFDVIECDGHSVEELKLALEKPTKCSKCIIANTIKGKEILFIKEQCGSAQFHWGSLSKENYERAIKELV